jgi:hypothetical protein
MNLSVKLKNRKKRFRKVNNNTRRKMKTVNCNPSIRNYRATNTTCYTNNALTSIRDTYNNNNISSKIISNNPQVILDELRSKISECTREDCWLNQFTKKEQKELEKKYFSPLQPVKWKTNPTEWLSNIDILQVLTQYQDTYKNFKFIGPTPIDFDYVPNRNGLCVWQELCTFSLKKIVDDKINKIGIIFNLDKHNESGSHWVSLFVDIKERFIFYFDSAANAIPNEIKNLISLITSQSNELNIPLHFHSNSSNQHQKGNTECGMYSLYFIITMLDNTSLTTKQKINIFKRGNIKDKFVESFRLKYFNTRTNSRKNSRR